MSDEKSQFQKLTSMNYIEQSKWFLNGFWDQGAKDECENVWKCTQKFIELDEKKKKEGNELDEFCSHKFLESLGETLTVLQLRDKLKKIDMDANGRMALLEYLAFKYSKTVRQVIDAPQGTAKKEELDEAQQKLQACTDAYAEVQTQLDQQTKALEEQKVAEEAARKALADQKQAEDIAKKALESQKKAEDVVRAAENELKAAVDDLTSQEDNYKNQIANLEAKSKDSSASKVAQSKAANELAQIKQEYPSLSLRKAKITQEAALRKVEKERKAAEVVTAAAQAKADEANAATKVAEAKTQEAEEKTQALEEQKKRVEESFVEAEARVAEAMAFLEEVKKKGGVAHGAIWWMEREFKEAQKYLPKRKQQQ